MPLVFSLFEIPMQANYTEIINALREFTAQETHEFLPIDPAPKNPFTYPPLQKYLDDLRNNTKPETAAENVLNSLWRDLMGQEPTKQVGLMDGFVDFMLPEPAGGFVPLELKPLFQRDKDGRSVWRSLANPAHHTKQVQKYLRDNEYVLLTDLHTVWCFGVRDFYAEQKPFNSIPFADFLVRCRENRSVLDVVRRLEDTAEKPELEQEFFDDLKKWFNEFDKVKWTPAESKDESIILLINKLIFARTIEDFGLVPFRYTQDSYIKHKRDWEAKGPHKIVPKFLNEFEEFFDEYYDTEIFSKRILDRLDKDPDNLQRFCDKLNFILGIGGWDETFKRGIVHYNYRRIDEDIFGKSYEMFLAANRKDEGIYYTPAGITAPMADAMVNSLTGKIVDEICECVGSQQCDFKRAEKLLGELAEIRIADTACGSGGFLIKVLRAFWRQYQRIDAASYWYVKLTAHDNGNLGQGGLNLNEIPPQVRDAQQLRSRWHFDNKQKLLMSVAENHLRATITDPIVRSVTILAFCRAIISLCEEGLNFRTLTGTTRAFPDLGKIFGNAIFAMKCRSRRRHDSMRCLQKTGIIRTL